MYFLLNKLVEDIL